MIYKEIKPLIISEDHYVKNFRFIPLYEYYPNQLYLITMASTDSVLYCNMARPMSLVQSIEPESIHQLGIFDG